jgi:hypothetical protein
MFDDPPDVDLTHKESVYVPADFVTPPLWKYPLPVTLQAVFFPSGSVA